MSHSGYSAFAYGESQLKKNKLAKENASLIFIVYFTQVKTLIFSLKQIKD